MTKNAPEQTTVEAELIAGIAMIWDVIERCHRLFQFDLRRMIEFGPDYNQAVKDVADAVSVAVESISK